MFAAANAHIVSEVGICTLLGQQLYHAGVSACTCEVERSHAILPNIESLACKGQCAYLILLVDVGALIEM